MRRPTHLGLAAVVLLLVITLGGYTAFWFTASGRVEDGIGEWASQHTSAHQPEERFNVHRINRSVGCVDFRSLGSPQPILDSLLANRRQLRVLLEKHIMNPRR